MYHHGSVVIYANPEEAPAHAAVEYETVNFTGGLRDESQFRGSSKEVDDAWNTMYNGAYWNYCIRSYLHR